MLEALHRTERLTNALRARLQQSTSLLMRLVLGLCLLVISMGSSVLAIVVMIFFPSSSSFQALTPLDPQHGYRRSYSQHRRWQKIVRFLTVTAGTGVIVQVILSSTYGLLSNPTAVYAATCNIAADTTVDQAYIDTNSCTDIHITGSSVITFTGSINLSGTGIFYVDNGATATFSGALNLTDVNDSVQIDGTVTHAAENGTGVNITAGSLTIGSTGIIDTNTKGCTNGASGGNGEGPNGTNVCTGSTAGATSGSASGAKAGAGHGGVGGISSAGVSPAGGIQYGSATAPVLLGSSSGNSTTQVGGKGGGVVRLNISGTFTDNGIIRADGGAGAGGSGNAAGGGSGGSIYITTATFNGTPSSISSNGGNGANATADGGGGAGGRISVTYTGGTFTPSSSLLTVTGGLGPDTAEDGSKGTVYVYNSATSTVTNYHGFTYGDTDHSVTTWTTDSSVTHQECENGAISPSVTATTLTQGGTILCNSPGLTSFNWSASSSFSLADSSSITISTTGADVDFNIPASSTHTWTNVNITTPAEGDFTINDAINLTLAGTTTITGNAKFTSLTNLTINSTASIIADSKGCQTSNTNNANGYGPNGSNVCAISTAGYATGASSGGLGGAAHGGLGGRGSTAANGATGTYGSATAPVLFGSSAGNNGTLRGGHGGGAIRLDVTGTLSVSGVLRTTGGNGNTGSGSSAGGGSGGSIYITTATFNNTPSSLSANGGNGADSSGDGGGGSGGRIAITYTGGTFSPSSSAILVDGGTGGTGSSATGGNKGSAYIFNSATSVVDIYGGFVYTDTDYNVTTWRIDSNAQSQYCDSTAISPSVTATNLTIAGTLSCTATGLTSFNWSAISTFSLADSSSLTLTTTGADMDMNIPAGGSYTWTNILVALGAEADWTINDAVSVTLAGTSTITANVQLTSLTNFTLDSTASINANSKGCQGVSTNNANGYGPDNSNVCTISTAGYTAGSASSGGRGGAAYGGPGGAGNQGAGGVIYGSPTAPTLYGSSAGNATSSRGGVGGGLVRINTSGTATINGSLSAIGGNGASSGGASSGGGGSGGAIYITTATFDGVPTSLSANGGNGGNGSGSDDAGGGGGGRIVITYTGGTFSHSSGLFTVSGGAAGSASATAGTKGTVYIKNTNTNAVTIYHGFDYDDTDYSVTTWTIDSSATNQTCKTATATPSITATNLTLNGTLACNLSTITSFNLSASSSFTLSSSTAWSVNAQNADMDWNIPAGTYTWTSATITGGAEGAFTIDDAATITLASTTINANTNWTNLAGLTVDASSTLNASSKGCQGVTTNNANGYGPDSSNVCAISTAGYSGGTGLSSDGAAHGGLGSAGVNGGTDAVTYGSNTAPILFGSTAGNGGGQKGGYGGGYIRLGISGANTLSISGSILADGGAGGSNGVGINAGGGSGGSIYITTGTLAGAPTISADGGTGGNGTGNDAGEGGGGRVRLEYVTDSTSSSWATTATAATVVVGADGGSSAVKAGDGTLSILQYAVPNTPSITAPAASATGVSRTPTVTSSAYSANGLSHTTSGWQISDNDTFSDGDCTDTNIVFCSLTSSQKESIVINTTNGTFQNALSGKTALAPNTIYYVRVQHTNSVGNSTWSASVSFTTTANTVPATPTNSAPANAATGVSKNPTLTASAFSDADSDSHATSDWLVFEANDCSGTADWTANASANLTSIVVNNTTGTFADSLAAQTTLKSHTVYSFKVRYIDTYSAQSSYSSCTSFTTTNNGPIFAGTISNQTFNEDQSSGVSAVFDLDDYFSDSDFNDDDQYSCSASNAFTAGLGIMTINGNRTVDFSLASNANGSDTVEFTCQDGGGLSATSNTVTITVTAVNDAPSFTKGSNQTVLEDAGAQTVTGWATAIAAGPGNESGQALTFTVNNDNNGLFSSQPTVSTSTGNLTYTPAANANGSATVTIHLSDDGGITNGGDDTSDDQTFTITVTAVNDTPTANGGSFSTNEDTTYTGTLTGSDVESSPLTYSIVTNGTKGTATITNANTGAFQYVPAANQTGSDSFTFKVNDGTVDSSAATISITLTAVNDVPSFTKGADQVVNEDAAAQTVTGWATALSKGPSDESSQTISFNVSNNNTTLFSAQPAISSTGNLTYALAANVNGSATITVSIFDTGGTTNGGDDTSDDQTFTISVAAVNDVPSFTKGADQTVLEDAGAQTVTGWATAISKGPSDESSQALTFTVTNDNNGLFSTQPAVSTSTGNLTYTPAANANGSATVTIHLSDNGGITNGGDDTSDDQTFTITVTAVNDAPSFTGPITDHTTTEDTSSTLFDLDTYFTEIDSSDTCTFTQPNSLDASLGTLIISDTHTVTLNVASNASGSDTVQFKCTDNSAAAVSSNTFTITIDPVNDAPTFTTLSDQTLVEQEDWNYTITTDDPEQQPLTLTATDLPAGLTFADQGDGTAVFAWIPTYEQAGSYDITVTLTDGVYTVTGDITLTVNQTNAPPVLTQAIPSITFTAGSSALDVLTLTDYFSDPDGDTLSFTSSGATLITVTINSAGAVSLASADTAAGSELITFTATDPDGLSTNSNSVAILIDQSSSHPLYDHVRGTPIGEGIITVYSTDSAQISQFRAFAQGGVVPRVGTIGDTPYIFSIKRQAGSTIHIYTLNGDHLLTQRLSPKLHWRQLDVGNLDRKRTTDEIVIATRRGGTLYFKIFSFSPRTNTLRIIKRQGFHIPLHSNDFAITVVKQAVHVIGSNGHTRLDWKPFRQRP